ncbi:substrate-binding periplasmic protein [Deefgea salmonis]|uniref:Transporter substrate-binding domain-containing protein n=1 Tax=Deefgea salmonis TaxID=2875502 RepID=A0ABS8BNJ3_9NEIS|nr:transporter substrate-binding domain-containing protein [Deefgea salmonis]MCB5197297.1 transporter substrate-binding domain-containing protein [Deefgea salmonis]
MPRNLFFYLVLFFAARCFAVPQEIELANGEWPPLLSASLPQYGYASQIVSRAFALENIQVKYRFYPWKRSLDEARRGNVQGSLLWIDSAERRQDFLYSQPVYRSKVVLFFNRDRPINWSQLNDLKGRRLGITHGYYYGAALSQLLLSQQVLSDIGNSDAQNFAKLLAKRVDGFPCEEIVGMYLIRHALGGKALEQLSISAPMIHEEPMYLLISRKTPNAEMLLQRFNRGQAKMQASGELNAILGAAQQR